MRKAGSLLFLSMLPFLALVAVSSGQETKSPALTLKSDFTPQPLSVPPDSPRWDLQGKAKVADYQGRKSLMLNGGAAILKDFEMRDGVIDVDVSTPAKRGFVGFDFRLDKDGVNYEELYLRQHESGLPDAIQYTPILNTGRNWQIYNDRGSRPAGVDIPKNEWFHLRLEVYLARRPSYMSRTWISPRW